MPTKLPCRECGTLRFPTLTSAGPVPVLCHECRRSVHGTVASYKKRGCRCDLCREAWNIECCEYQRAKRVRLVRSCVECSAEFNPRANQIRCSAACQRAWRAKNKAARRGAVLVDSIDPLVIYERDAWLCGICGLAVDRSEKYPEPGSPSIDHVIPISLGGSHIEANLRLAHFYCNVVRGNRVEVEAC